MIALPVLALILAAILHVGQLAHHRQEMNDQARECAWQYALSGCTDLGALPPYCQDALATVEGVDESAQESLDRADVPPGILDDLADIPGIGVLFERLVGHTIEARIHATYARPILLGGGDVDAQAATRVLCNTVPSHGELAETLFNHYWD